MDKEMIKSIRCELEQQMKFALAKMNFSQDIYTLREKIKDLQANCPHDEKSAVCPYCVKER